MKYVQTAGKKGGFRAEQSENIHKTMNNIHSVSVPEGTCLLEQLSAFVQGLVFAA